MVSVSTASVQSEQEAPRTEALTTGQDSEQLVSGQTSDEASAEEASKAAAHPLRVYCEYLSYLFRKPPMPDGQEQLEVGYRDYLQVSKLDGSSRYCIPCQYLLHEPQCFQRSRNP